MKSVTKFFFIIIIAALFGCSKDSDDSPPPPQPSIQCPVTEAVPGQGALSDLNYVTSSIDSSNLVVMTRNLYLGADIQKLLAITDLSSLVSTVSALYSELIENQFARRARGLAREIARLNPHVIALQEVEAIYTGYSDFLKNPESNASCLEIDFLSILMTALSEQNVSYQVAQKTKNADIELTDLTKDVRIIDYDVILVKEGLAFSGASSRAFQSQLTISMDSIPGAGSAVVQRSFSEIQLSVNDQTVYLVNTHLEVDEAIQILQANELAEYLDELSNKGNVILAGDLNSIPGVAGNSYANILNIGFSDTYSGAQFTCCYPSLTDNGASLATRVDYILYKAFSSSISVDGIIFTGITEDEKVFTTDGILIWPSDHAGVTTGLTISP